MLLDPTNDRHMESYGNKHVLILRNVGEPDFGNYSCTADNRYVNVHNFVEFLTKTDNELAIFVD